MHLPLPCAHSCKRQCCHITLDLLNVLSASSEVIEVRSFDQLCCTASHLAAKCNRAMAKT